MYIVKAPVGQYVTLQVLTFQLRKALFLATLLASSKSRFLENIDGAINLKWQQMHTVFCAVFIQQHKGHIGDVYNTLESWTNDNMFNSQRNTVKF